MNPHREFTLCTLCLSFECQLLYAFDRNESDIALPAVIRDVLQFEVLEDGSIPWMVCTNCIQKLKDFRDFKKQAAKSMNVLQIMLVDRRADRMNTLADGVPVPIKMEEVDLNEPAENAFLNSFDESMKGEHCHVESQMCTAEERDIFEEPPPEKENSSISAANCSNVEEHFSDIHNSENVMHVKHEDVEKEIPPPEECLSPSSEKGSVEEVQCSNVHGSASEVAMDKEEVMDQDDLCLQLSSSSSDESSDVEERALRIAGPRAEVNGLHCTDEISVPVDGDVERLGNSDETLIREKGPNRMKVTGHQRSARKENDAMLPVLAPSHLKQKRLRSHCRNENYGLDENNESTSSSTSGKLFCEENGKHTERTDKIRKESKHGISGHAKNISIGSCVGDEKSEGRDYRCDGCGKVFRSKDLMKRHVNVPCGSELVDCGIFRTNCRNRNEYKRHRSLHCGSNVSRRRVQGGVSVDVCGASEGKRQIKKRNPPTCHICQKNFSQRGHLNVHIKTVHLKERKFSCEICGKSFGRKGNLQRHMRYHSGVKPYTCSHCQKGFTRSGHLRKHIRAVHKMEKPHTCGECGKAFSDISNLNKHMLIHTGERPHTCTLCSKTFGHISNLKRHLATHARKVPHPCNHCTKTFAFISELQRHLAKHRGEDID